MKRMNVVIADDEYLVREHLKRIVCWEQLGFKVIEEVENGQEAVDYIEKSHNHVNLIIMDICMPILDGIEASKKIREINENCHIIILTGHDDFEYARQSIKIGVADYLSKPINKREVVRALESIIEKEKEKSKEDQKIVLETISKIRCQDEEGDIYSSKINELMSLVHQELDNKDLSLNYASKKLFTNVSYLSRRFKEETGQNFSKYLIECRMEKALKLIHETPMKNYEIAEAIGIDDPNYFSYAFKQYMKISVTDYRKSLRTDIEISEK